MGNRGEKIMKSVLRSIAAVIAFAGVSCAATALWAEGPPLPIHNAPAETPKEAAKDGKKNLVSMSLKDVNIEDALKIISEASGHNVILDSDVKAKTSVNLKNVPWQVALDIILKTNELTYTLQDNIIRVMSIGSLKREEETLPLTTKILSLNFAKAEDLQKSLLKILSPRGSIEINIPTNSLIISDSPEKLAKIEEVVSKLDMRTPQVMIEAMLVSFKLTDTFKAGLDWKLTDNRDGVGTRNVTQSLKIPSGSILDLYYYHGKNVIGPWELGDTQLTLLGEDKRVKILANPKILTLDNLPAQIEITEQVPYTYTSSSTQGGTVTSTQFKDIGIKLYVTPHITKDRTISLSVRGEQSFVASFVGATNEPSIDSRKVETNFMLRDGETVIIGGLKKKDNTTTVTKIPLLGDIPIIGKALFSRTVRETVDNELLIFITPEIMDDPIILTEEEEKKFNAATEELAKRNIPESKMNIIAQALRLQETQSAGK